MKQLRRLYLARGLTSYAPSIDQTLGAEDFFTPEDLLEDE